MKKSTIAIAVFTVSIAVSDAAIITIDSAIARSAGGGRLASNIINGLSGGAPATEMELTAGGSVDNPSDWRMNAANDSLSIGEGWMAGSATDSSQWVILDLGSTIPLGSLSIWNLNTDGTNAAFQNRGASALDVYGRTTAGFTNTDIDDANFDPTGWTLISAGVTPSANPGGAQVASPNATVSFSSARYIALNITDSYLSGVTGDFVGIGEVQAFSVPEPTSTLLVALSGGLLALRRRRN